MKKQLRNRRSDSSCSAYSYHSNSLAHLQPLDLQQKQKREEYKLSDIDSTIIGVYKNICQYETENVKPEISILKQWRRNLKNGIVKLRQFSKKNQQTLQNLKASLEQLQLAKSVQIRNLRSSQEEQVKQLEKENSKNIKNMMAQFGKKQEYYKQMMSKFVQTLQQSQRNWIMIQDQLVAKVKKAQNLLKQRIEVDSKNYAIFEQVAMITEEIYHYQDDSLRSINLSQDEVAPQIPKLESRKNTIDISSIDKFDDPSEGQQPYQDGFEEYLVKMICWGFFSQKNQNYVRKIIEITKNFEDPESIIKQPIFPIIMQAIKLNLDLDRQPNMSEASNSYQDTKRLVMRDIQSQRILL